MKKASILIALILSVFLITVVASDIKDFHKTVDFNSGSSLKIETYKGTIHLVSWDRNEVVVTATIEAPADVDEEYAAAIVEATEVEVSGNSGKLYIRSNYDDVPSQSGWFGVGTQKTLPYVHYEIKAPYNVNLRIKDYKSKIEIRDFEGEFDIETYQGQMTIDDLIGEIRIDTYKGTGDFTGFSGSLDIETYKGELTIRADEITGNSRLETYKGDITLVIPQEQPLQLRADISKKGTLRYFDEKITHKFKGDLGKSGTKGPKLTVETYKGNIRIR